MAIRAQLDKHASEVQHSIARQSYGVEAFGHNLADFERYKAKGEKIKISIVGVYNISSNVPVALADEVVESIKVYGIFQASDAVKAALTKSGKIK